MDELFEFDPTCTRALVPFSGVYADDVTLKLLAGRGEIDKKKKGYPLLGSPF